MITKSQAAKYKADAEKYLAEINSMLTQFADDTEEFLIYTSKRHRYEKMIKLYESVLNS